MGHPIVKDLSTLSNVSLLIYDDRKYCMELKLPIFIKSYSTAYILFKFYYGIAVF